MATLPEQWHSTKLFAKHGDTPVVCHYLMELIQRPPVNLNFQIEVSVSEFWYHQGNEFDV